MNYKELIKHPFMVDNFWYGLSSIFSNLLNYAYVLIALHYLSKDRFGAFNALVAILTMATVVANPLQLHVTKSISHLKTTALRTYVEAMLGNILKFAVVFLLFLFLVSQYLASILSVSAGHIIIVGIAIAFLILATFATAVSSGLRKLTFQAFLGVGSTVLKLLCALVLFEAGLGVAAGLLGYIAGFALTLAISWYALKGWAKSSETGVQPQSRKESVHVLVFSYFFVAMPFSMDQILAQALNPAISGDYAALVTVGKLAFFVSVPFQVVLYSYLAGSRSARQQMNYLRAGLVAAIGSSLLLTALLWVGGPALANLLLTPGYAPVVSRWIVPYSLGMCGYVFAYGVVSLAIARNDPRVLLPISFAAIAQIALFLVQHDTLAQLVANQLVSLGLLSLAAIVYLVFFPPRGDLATH